MIWKNLPRLFLFLACLGLLAACDGQKEAAGEKLSTEDARRDSRGKMTGEDGWVLFGGDKKEQGGANIGVNGFLWRATLDTLSFMPIASADPFGGVVITDWYEDPKTPGERFKVNAFILDRNLRADAVKIKVFKQAKDGADWKDTEVNERTAREIEDTILTRARQLRVAQLEGGK